MRPIKCRAWDETRKELVNYGFCLRFDAQGNCTITNVFGMPFTERKLIPLLWTGLVDRHGTEVYEGDIIAIEGATAKVVFWERPPEFGLDYYHNERAWCEDWNLCDDSYRMEVIGNIYENADLLAVQP